MPCWRISSAVVNLDECLNYYMPIIITITWIHCCDSTVWVHCRVPTVYCCHCSHQCSPFTVTVVPVNQPVMCVQGGVRLLVEGDDNPDVCISRRTSISVIVDRRTPCNARLRSRSRSRSTVHKPTSQSVTAVFLCQWHDGRSRECRRSRNHCWKGWSWNSWHCRNSTVADPNDAETSASKQSVILTVYATGMTFTKLWNNSWFRFLRIFHVWLGS